MSNSILNVGRISECFVLERIEAGTSMEVYNFMNLDKVD